MLYSYTNLGAPFKVTEFHFHPDVASPLPPCALPPAPNEILGPDVHPLAGEKYIWPSIEDKETSFSIQPGFIYHSVPCLGYVLQEAPLAGTIKPADYIPHLKRNAAALGVKNPMSLLSKIQQGETLNLPDGTILTPPASRPGRKLVILGDTSDPAPMAAIAEGADVLVHEATNTYFSDAEPGLDPQSFEEKTKSHGHSTSEMAGKFASKIGAKSLILNHFSPRYNSTDKDLMAAIAQRAADALGQQRPVLCAEDFMQVEVGSHQPFAIKGEFNSGETVLPHHSKA